MKKTVSAHLYAWVSDSGRLGDFQLTRYEMSGENWLPIHKDENGRSKLIEIEVEVPDSFHSSWQAEAVANVEREEQRARAELQAKLRDLWEMKEKLLALPAPTEEGSEGPY